MEIDPYRSWNLNELTVNGKDLKHVWTNSMPPAVDGQWVIYYDGSESSSHFEAKQVANQPHHLTLLPTAPLFIS